MLRATPGDPGRSRGASEAVRHVIISPQRHTCPSVTSDQSVMTKLLTVWGVPPETVRLRWNSRRSLKKHKPIYGALDLF